MGLSEYIQWRMQDDVLPVIKNYYVRFLCNLLDPAMKVNDLDFERALQRLFLNNVLVDTVERFDESMVFFKERLKRSFPEIDLSYVRQNIGLYNSDSPLLFLDDITPQSRELLIENNQLDKKIHKIVGNGLEETCRKIKDFNAKLEKFRVRWYSF